MERSACSPITKPPRRTTILPDAVPCPATPRHRVEGVAIVLHFGRRPRVGTPSRSSARCERVTGTPNFARRDASYGGREDNAPSTNPQCASLNALSPGRSTSHPAAIKVWYPMTRADIGCQPFRMVSPATRARVTKLRVRRTTLDRDDCPPRQLRCIVLRHAGGELADLPRRARVVQPKLRKPRFARFPVDACRRPIHGEGQPLFAVRRMSRTFVRLRKVRWRASFLGYRGDPG